MHIIAIGGSDAGISAALRACEFDPGVEVTVVVADAYPNFSICGIPYYVSGEVTDWHNLAHRTRTALEATGMQLRLDTVARRIDVAQRQLVVTGADGHEELLSYDALIVGTGAVPVRPLIAGLDGPMPLALPTACTSSIPWATRLLSCKHSKSSRQRRPSSLAPATSAWRWPTL